MLDLQVQACVMGGFPIWLGITQANKNIARGLRNTEYGYCTPDVPHVSDVVTSGARPALEANPVDIEVRTPLVRHNGGTVLSDS